MEVGSGIVRFCAAAITLKSGPLSPLVRPRLLSVLVNRSLVVVIPCKLIPREPILKGPLFRTGGTTVLML
ncbi:MAG: hypothetical protein RLZZ148_2008, partial [Cyanobacteriota bacterium]